MKTSEKWFAKPMKIAAIAVLMQIINISAFSQCQPYIKIDGNQIYANQNSATGIILPTWLKDGQRLAADQMVNSVSVIEFTVNGSSLEFSQVLSVTTEQTVQAGKVWKIESIHKQPSFGSAGSVTFSQTGTYSFTVPACANYICVEVWGGGGGGAGTDGTNGSGGGGGGGGYGQGCFAVTPGSSHSVIVGTGGSGRSSSNGLDGNPSSVGTLISANGGGGGLWRGNGGAGGAGGTSTAPVNIQGGAGESGTTLCTPRGGMGGNGGLGGSSSSCNSGAAGTAPGGGGEGGGTNTSNSGGAGAEGKVNITW